MFYTFCRTLVVICYRILFPYTVEGKEHVPENGAVLLCSNHISNLDPPLVGISVDRQVWFMAKRELFKIPLISFLLRQLGAMPIKRGASDKSAIRKALTTLQEEKVFVVFPEGTRSKTGQLGKGYSGAGFLALREECTVLPVAVIGPYRLFRRIRVVIGPPVPLDDLKASAGRNSAKQATERIMDHIGALLDQSEVYSQSDNGRSL